MNNLAMHLADIAQNAIRAKAGRIEISFFENNAENTLLFIVKDNGQGMTPEILQRVGDPFFTTRTTRKVGLGIPFLKMTSEQTGGWCDISSKPGSGTTIEALYRTDNPDCLPLGDIAGYLVLTFQANPTIHFRFAYRLDTHLFVVDTEELKKEGIILSSHAGMVEALTEYVQLNLEELFANRKTESFLS